MSAIEEVVSALQSVVEELNNAQGATGTAKSESDDAISQAAALGASNVIAGLEAVQRTIEQLTTEIRAAIDTADEAINQAKAVADGT